MSKKNYLAIDIGAESGRGIIGSFDGNKIFLKEISRFPTYNIKIFSHIYWDVFSIFSEIKKIIQKSVKEEDISGIGITTWGVDYGLVGKGDILLSSPFHYRDRRTDGIVEEVFNIVPKEEIFKATGIQFMQINTLFQLYSTLKEFPYLLDLCETLLFMPDIFNFYLTGEKYAEYTISTTSQMYNNLEKGQPKAPRGNWIYKILEKIGLPVHFLPKVVSPGLVLGKINSYLREELDCSEIPVFSVCCHDTASAVISVPAKEGNWAYLSSGTWSLLGIETPNPIINEKSFKYNFTNEGGFAGSIRFLKNIMGLWILQECRREWEKKGKKYSYEELVQMACLSEPFYALIDVNEKEFLFPGNMPDKIQKYCQKTGQKVPQTEGQITRVILESLAMEYRDVIEKIEEITGERIETLHIVGGGSQNTLLSQFTASSTKKLVITGPVEATASGNILVQILSTEGISDIFKLREIVRNSFPLIVYQPKDTSIWEEKYFVYKKIKEIYGF